MMTAFKLLLSQLPLVAVMQSDIKIHSHAYFTLIIQVLQFQVMSIATVQPTGASGGAHQYS